MILARLFDSRRNPNLGANQSLLRRSGWLGARIAIFALSCVLGLAYAFTVVGPRVLNPLDVSWLTDDPATGFLGWGFFRQETHLTLPLGWSSAIGYPLGEPIAYFDSLPILATVGWVIRGILPENLQYFGLYFVLCCILQFYFGLRISRRLCGGNRVASILGGALFLISPAFTWRALGHFALISHWVILAALDQLLGGSARPTRARIAWRGILCFVAGGINPYIAVMTFLVLSGTYLRTLLCQRNCLTRSCVGLGVALCLTIASLMLFGFVRGTDVSQYAGNDYEKYSMNLLAPINPQGYGALLLREQPPHSETPEDYNYLGLGLVLLAMVAIARRPSSLGLLLMIETIPAVGIFLISLLLALSLLAKAGDFTLWHFALPHPIMAVLASLRGAGRLFWPGYYLLFIGTIAAASGAFSHRWLQVALGLAVVVQFSDVAPLRTFIYHHWQASASPSVSSNAAWHNLGLAHRHLVVLPPWQCSFSLSPGGFNGYAIFGRLALDQHMTINSFYAARYSNAQLGYFCSEQMSRIMRDGLQSDTAYVLRGNMAAGAIGLRQNGEYCRRVDEYILCSQVAGHEGLNPGIVNDAVTLRRGAVVPFSASSKIADGLIGLGWSEPEPWGRWMSGHAATLAFRLPALPQGDVRIELTILPLVSPSHPVERVDVMVNDKILAQQTFAQAVDSLFGFVVPAGLIGDDGLVRLVFNLPDAISPSSIGMHTDQRVLSIAVKQLRIEDAGN